MSSTENESAPAPSTRIRPRAVLVASGREEILDRMRTAAEEMRAECPDRVEFVDRGAAALEAVASKGFDALVLDGGLDDVAALTVFERARAGNAGIRAVVFTDRFDEVIERTMVELGFVACVPLADAYKVGFFERALAAMTIGGERRARPSDGSAIFAMILAMSEPALLADHFGRIRLSNRAFAEAASLGRASAVGHDVSEFFPEVGGRDLAARVGEEPAPLELRRKSGNIEVVVPRFVELDDGGENLIGILF